MAALSSLKCQGPSRIFYDRKRSERLIHTQALLALGRRLVDVLRALLPGRIVRTLGIGETSANSAEFLWKACSAFAHGDSWPTHAILEREELDTSTDTVAHLRVSAPMPSLVTILPLVLLFADRTFTLHTSRRGA
jgi:hypothetical protein